MPNDSLREEIEPTRRAALAYIASNRPDVQHRRTHLRNLKNCEARLGVFEGGGTQGSLRLALFTAKQGDAVEGWLAFNVGREMLYIPFQGENRCTGDDCHLSATCTQSVPQQSPNPYFRKGDRIVLNGKSGHGLEGSLQADSQEVFKNGNQTVKYALKFSSQQ